MSTITKKVLDEGDHTQYVSKYDKIALEYTGKRLQWVTCSMADQSRVGEGPKPTRREGYPVSLTQLYSRKTSVVLIVFQDSIPPLDAETLSL